MCVWGAEAATGNVSWKPLRLADLRKVCSTAQQKASSVGCIAPLLLGFVRCFEFNRSGRIGWRCAQYRGKPCGLLVRVHCAGAGLATCTALCARNVDVSPPTRPRRPRNQCNGLRQQCWKTVSHRSACAVARLPRNVSLPNMGIMVTK